MNLTDFFNNLKYNYLGKRIFRSEVEAMFYSKKKVALPKIPPVTKSNLADFKIKYPLNFYKEPDDFQKAKEELLKLENGKEILASAESVLQNKYDILNSGEINLGEKINWNYDYKSNYEWKSNLFWQADLFDVPKGTDLKYPWELARFHQALWLGKAYLITKDEKYTEKFLSLWEDFNTSNPFCAGPNWLNSKEVAIRLINITFAFGFFMLSEKIDETIINKYLDFLLLYSYYLENNLEYSSKRDSKYLAALLGLGIIGLIIKDHPYGKKNINFAQQKLEQEIRLQIYNDGVSYEQSVPYHSTILELFYIAKSIYEKSGSKFSDGFNEQIKKMFIAQSAYLRKDNSVPHIGDIISSRILEYKHAIGTIDFSYTLPIGAYLFNDSRLRYYNSTDVSDLIFLFGADSIERYKNIKIESPDFHSTGFSKGGHFIFRTFNLHFFIEAGDIGKNGGGAPGHDDTFSFDLFYKNKNIIVDSGTFSYFNDRLLRNRLRSVKHHNSVYVDNEYLTEYKGVFKIKEDLTKPEIFEWSSDKNEDKLILQHHAYLRLVDPVVCKRSFHFLKDQNIIKIKDDFFGGAAHQASGSIHFHPDVEVTKISELEFSAKNGDAGILIKFEASTENIFAVIQDTEYSASYGHLTSAKKILYSISETFPAYIDTEITLL